MGSQSLLALTSRRAEISQCIRLLEARPSAPADPAATQFLEGLRRKADWLDKRIDAELRESDPLERPRVAKIDPSSRVA